MTNEVPTDDSKLELRIKLSDDGLGTAEDDALTFELQEVLDEVLSKRELGRATYAVTGGGRSSFFFEGADAASMYDAVADTVNAWPHRLVRAVLHRVKELDWANLEDLTGDTQTSHCIVVHVRLSDDDCGTKADDALLYPLSARIDEALERSGVGVLDGHGWGCGWFDFFCYGGDPEGLFGEVEPLLDCLGSREVVCEIGPSALPYPSPRAASQPDQAAC